MVSSYGCCAAAGTGGTGAKPNNSRPEPAAQADAKSATVAGMQEFIDGATAVAAILAAAGAWSNARRIDRLTGRVDALERTVQTVLMILAGRAASAAGGSLPPPAAGSGSSPGPTSTSG